MDGQIDLDLVRALEERCVNAWPALRTLLVDGWALRLSDGHTRRANSASPLHPSRMETAALVDLVETTFRAAGLRPLIRLTPLARPSVEAELVARGWVEEDPSLVLVGQGPPPCGALPPGVAARLDATLSEAWLGPAMIAYEHGETGAQALRRTLPLIALPHVYATLSLDGRPAAFGLAVAERGYVGLYDLVVDPAARRRGLGRALVETLWVWGAARGAAKVYLQVREANVTARALYERLGLRVAYRYTQRAAVTSRSP